MNMRAFGIVAALWVMFAPLTALWLMWEFAFQGEMMGRIGEALIALVLLGPPAICALLYVKDKRTNASNR